VGDKIKRIGNSVTNQIRHCWLHRQSGDGRRGKEEVMQKLFLVWNANHEFGDVTIASFSEESDAILFAKTKAKKEGGYVGSLWVGTTHEDRRQLSVD
jgi:hypothetical protein